MPRTFRRFFFRPINLVASFYLILMLFVAMFPKMVASHDPLFMDYSALLEKPSPRHWFGTDQFGRDIFSRCIYGLQKSVLIAFSSVGLALLVGTALGLISGFYGGVIDLVTMRVVEGLFAFPSLILALFIVALFGSSTTNLVIAIAVVYTPIFARTVRGEVFSIKDRLFVKAALVIGKSNQRIMFTEILPNLSSVLIVSTTTNLSTAFLTEASLGFLGLSVPPPYPTLGGLVGQGTAYLLSAPWITLFPGFVIATVVLTINIIGDGLRDLLDPRTRG